MLRDEVLLAFEGLDNQPLHGAWAKLREGDKHRRALADAGQEKDSCFCRM